MSFPGFSVLGKTPLDEGGRTSSGLNPHPFFAMRSRGERTNNEKKSGCEEMQPLGVCLNIRPQRAFMKIPYYTRTAGLDRHPQSERFAIYRATHKRLLREDVGYRKRWSSYIAAVVCLTIVPIIGWAAIVYLAFRQQAFQNRKIGDVLQAVA
jgi:hypothetical protein